jgi:DNA-directed RNA polymerase subunit RPC12/RpoP
MIAATFACNSCKTKFQVIGISTRNDPNYCPYCGRGSIHGDNIILC